MTVASTVREREYSPADIASHQFWGRSFEERDRAFAKRLAVEGLSWHQPLSSLFDLEEPGFWALTRPADITFVSLHPEWFTSARGVALDPMPAEVPVGTRPR